MKKRISDTSIRWWRGRSAAIGGSAPEIKTLAVYSVEPSEIAGKF